MADQDYYSSERFIQIALIERAELGIATLYDTWRRNGQISPFVIFWPATTVRDSNGIELEGPCLRELDTEKANWHKQIVEGIKLTNAYALLLVQQRANKVLAILESQHGVVNWSLPI